MSAHEIFESHLKISSRDLKISTNFKNRYQILANPYVSTSRENRRRIGAPGFGIFAKVGADLYRRRCIILKPGTGCFFKFLKNYLSAPWEHRAPMEAGYSQVFFMTCYVFATSQKINIKIKYKILRKTRNDPIPWMGYCQVPCLGPRSKL